MFSKLLSEKTFAPMFGQVHVSIFDKLFSTFCLPFCLIVHATTHKWKLLPKLPFLGSIIVGKEMEFLVAVAGSSS